MTITTPLRSDHDIQAAVQMELEWTPELDASGIGVASDDGAVTLSGEVGTYLARLAATDAVLRVRGVRAVVDDLVVHSPSYSSKPSETDLAKSIQRALEWTSGVPASVTAELHGRAVTLKGEADWDFERRSAQRAIEHLEGVDYLENRITLRARPTHDGAAAQIANALDRNASLYGTEVTVTVTGTTAKLSGVVHTGAQRRSAENVAWSSPHVTHIENRIIVSWF